MKIPSLPIRPLTVHVARAQSISNTEGVFLSEAEIQEIPDPLPPVMAGTFSHGTGPARVAGRTAEFRSGVCLLEDTEAGTVSLFRKGDNPEVLDVFPHCKVQLSRGNRDYSAYDGPMVISNADMSESIYEGGRIVVSLTCLPNRRYTIENGKVTTGEERVSTATLMLQPDGSIYERETNAGQETVRKIRPFVPAQYLIWPPGPRSAPARSPGPPLG